MILSLALISLLLAAIPLCLFSQNLKAFCSNFQTTSTTPSVAGNAEAGLELPRVSLLIPARDEAGGIEKCLDKALDSRSIVLEILVLDDHSADDTALIVDKFTSIHSNVRRIAGQALPDTWNGKQFACAQLADHANFETLVFIDADVRLEPNALASLIRYQQDRNIDLLSAFPKQETGSWLEHWMIPMMHIILLGYLPIGRMRKNKHEAFAAGCGQLFVTRKDAYIQSGGHAALKTSRHDGLMLPRVYRRAALITDIIDGTSIASCRMYHSASEVIRGVLKNADEGIAKPRLILIFSVLLLGSVTLPAITLAIGLLSANWLVSGISALALALGHIPRILVSINFRQSWIGVAFHLPALTTFVALQWIAFVLHLIGFSVSWRGRRDA